MARFPENEFHYSDGNEAEERILKLLFEATDLRSCSSALANAAVDWPSRVHLSAERRNLLVPFKSLLRGSVLELGAGFGAITRFLGETATAVTAIEGSERRARGARARCRDLPNVEVVESEFLSWENSDRFSAVVAVGFLEYAANGSSAPDPHLGTLVRMRELLEPDGVLLLAIENEIGLRYLAGAPEPHVGIPYFGVNDFYGAQTPRTFGRKELGRLLTAAGFGYTEWLYPLPHYHFPSLIVHSDACACPALDLGAILGSTLFGKFNMHETPGLATERALTLAWRNGVFEDLAESFLVLARTRPPLQNPSPKPLVFSFSTGRLPEFQKFLIIESDGDEIRARNEAAQPELVDVSGRYIHDLPSGPYLQGRNYSDTLWSVVSQPGWTIERLADWMRPWIKYLEGFAIDLGSESPRLPNDLLECTPYNLVLLADGTLRAFDLEYSAPEQVPLCYVVFRGVWYCFVRLSGCAEPDASVPRLLIDLVRAAMREVGLEVSDDRLFDLVKREADMQVEITGHSRDKVFTPFATLRLPVIESGKSAAAESQFRCQVYWRTAGTEYTEVASAAATLSASAAVQYIRLEIPSIDGISAIRLDVTDRPSLVYVESVALTDNSGRELRRWSAAEAAAGCSGGTAVIVDRGDPNRFFVASSTYDPQLQLPVEPSVAVGCLDGAVLCPFCAFPAGPQAQRALYDSETAALLAATEKAAEDIRARVDRNESANQSRQGELLRASAMLTDAVETLASRIDGFVTRTARSVVVLENGLERNQLALSSLRSFIETTARNVENIYQSKIWVCLTRGARLIQSVQAAPAQVKKRLNRIVYSSRKLFRQSAAAEAYLVCDEPAASDLTPRSGLITVRGWAAATCDITVVRLKVFDQPWVTAKLGEARPDVGRANQHLRSASRSGWSSVLDSISLPHGRHLIKIEAETENGQNLTVHTYVVIDHNHGFRSDYDRWIAEFDSRNPDNIQHRIQAFAYSPAISIIMPVYQCPPEMWRIYSTSNRRIKPCRSPLAAILNNLAH